MKDITHAETEPGARGTARTGTGTDRWPAAPEDERTGTREGSAYEDVACSTMGVFAPLVGVVGAMQAAEAMKIVAGIGQPLAGRLLLLEGRAMEWTSIAVAHDPNCPVCSTHA